MGTIIFHADLDAFYASVEQLDNPELAGLPIVVGALPGHRGVVSACSYEARAFGVHSAMPISEAARRCPQACFLPVRMKRYQELSSRIMTLFHDFAPEVRQISVDEAFLNLSGTERIYGKPIEAGLELKNRVKEKTGLTVSIGIGTNRYIAKNASAVCKPNGLLYVAPGEEEAFLDSIPLFSLWGIGAKTAEELKKGGFRDVPSVRRESLQSLRRCMGNAGASFLYDIVRGKDPGIFNDFSKSRSLSGERTYERDVRDVQVLRATLLELAEELRFRMLAEGLHTRTIQLKLRYEDFQTLTVRETYNNPPHSIEEIYSIACILLKHKWDTTRAIRLIGLALVNVKDNGTTTQGELFTDKAEKRRRVEEAILALKERQGAVVTKARLVPPLDKK